MSKSLKHWYPRYSGDYRAKTAGLSLIQHGAYTLLLDEYYNTGKPLTAIAVHLHRVCSALAPEEQEAVDFIVDTFFIKTENGYINKRVEEELAKRGKISDARRNAANSRYAIAPTIAPAIAPAIASTSTSTSTSTATSTTKSKNIDIDQFENFWAVYGYKVSREKAEIAYAKTIKSGVTHNEIISGVTRYQRDCQNRGVSGKFIKQPTTWLNGKCWNDEYPDYGSAGNPTEERPSSNRDRFMSAIFNA